MLRYILRFMLCLLYKMSGSYGSGFRVGFADFGPSTKSNNVFNFRARDAINTLAFWVEFVGIDYLRINPVADRATSYI